MSAEEERVGAPEMIDIDMTLRALVGGNRRATLHVIRSSPQPVDAVAQTVGLPQQITSHHLRIPQEARLVIATIDHTRRLYALSTDGLAATCSYLDDFWPERLVALKVAVEQRQEKQHG